jgi:cytochrome d ubiquinol oxidase subunit I
VFAVFEIAQGHMNAEILQTAQPTKLAAMEAHWETARQAPIHLLAWPDPAGERNSVQSLTVPAALSLMAGYSPDTEVKGLKDYPADQRPPVLPVFLSFRLMVGLAFLFLAVALYAFLKRASIEDQPRFLRLLPWMIPLPYLANTLGWTIAELGRQPWIVYGIMRTRDAVSPIQTVQVATSLAAFVLVYGLLGAADFYLLCKFARKGPDPLTAR